MKTTVILNDAEDMDHEFTIEYNAYEGESESRDNPGYSDEIEILSVKDEFGNTADFSKDKKTMAIIENACWVDLKSNY